MVARLGGNTKSARISRETVVHWILIAILLLGFGLRVYRLADKGIWFDEGWSSWMARKSLVGIAERTAYDTHPPLYFWVLHAWRAGSGDSEFGLRFLSVAVGVFTVAATYLLGRTVAGRGPGALAALLVSISRFNIWWSQEVRMYSLAALLATLSLWAAVRLWDRHRPRDWVLYVLFTVAGLYTLYLFVLVMAVTNLVWLWVLLHSGNRRRELARWATAQLVVLLLFVPWLVYALGRIPTWSVATPVALGQFVQIYWTVLTTGISVNVEDYRWLVAPVLAIFLAALTSLFWEGRLDWRMGRNTVLLLLGLLLPAGMVYLISIPREAFFYSPQLAPRYLLLFAPSLYILLAWGLEKIGAGRRWSLGAFLTSIVVGVALFGLWQYYPGRILVDDYKALAATLRAYRRVDDAVVLYTDRDWPVFDYHVPSFWVGIPNGQPMTPGTADYYLSPVWVDHQGVWLVVTPDSSINDPLGEVPAWLAARATRVVEYRFTDKVLRFYARTEERAGEAQKLALSVEPSHPVQADLWPGLQLVGYDQPVREIRGGDILHLLLYFRRRGGVDNSGAGLEVSLVSEDGTTWKRVQVPWPPLDMGSAYVLQQVDIPTPPDAPDGPYSFVLRALSGGQEVCLGRIRLKGQRNVALAVDDVQVAQPIESSFAEGIRLLGYDVETSKLTPGDTLPLTLYWEAGQPIEHRYKVFTHLLGETFNEGTSSFLWGQQDNEPVGGARPTSTWRAGEVIVDHYSIPLAPTAPTGRYLLEVGMYDPATGARLPVLDGEGRTVAEQVNLTYVMVEGR